MLRKTNFWILLLLSSLMGVAATLAAGQAIGTQKWVVGENSSLRINGCTNINTFACDIPAYDRTDTLIISENNNGQEVTLTGCVNLNVESFDCHNAVMTHNLRKTLKEKEFPVLHIRFLSLSKLPCLSAHPEPVTGLVDIEIAGTCKRFSVNYQISIDDQNVIHLVGSRDVNFSDFGLVPPDALYGIVRTKDKLSVDFHLKIKAINQVSRI